MKGINGYATTRRMLALLLCGLLLAGLLPSLGALGASRNNLGNLHVALSTDVANLPRGSTVQFSLYKIGDPAPGSLAGWEFNSDIASYGRQIIQAKDESALQKVVNNLAAVITDKYRGTTKDLSSGSAEFSNLAQGVYLGVLTKAPEGLTANASLITIPSTDPKTMQLRLNYNITVKDSYATTSPSVSPTTSPTRANTQPPTGGGGGGGGGAPAPTPKPLTEVSVTKKWVDGNNEASVRPDTIDVVLYANGSPVNVTPTWSKGGNTWSCTFTDLDKYDGSGREIDYTVSEIRLPSGYTSQTAHSGNDWTITNTYRQEPEYADFSGVKSWNDNNNEQGKRPAVITVRLIGSDGSEYVSHPSLGTNWKYSFSHVMVRDEFGRTITYALKEEGISGYFPVYSGMNVTNKMLPPDVPTPNSPPAPKQSVKAFANLTEEELEELFDMFGYGMPLYGMLGTGDQIPAWVWACGGAGLLALVLFIVTGRKKRQSK